MQQYDKINGYLKKVCDQIRWKKAHGFVTKELEDHIIDQKDTFLAEGMSEDESIEKAIEEMGDPIAVGTELDRTHKPKPEWSIIFLTCMLVIVGTLIRIFMASDTFSSNTFHDLMLTILGIGVMIFTYFLDYTTIGKYPRLIYFGLILISIASMDILPSVFNGISRLRGQYFYPKFLMLLFPTAFAGIVYSMRNRGYEGIILSGIYYIFPAIICYFIPSSANLVMYTITCLIILTYAILKGWFNVKKLDAILLLYIPTVILSGVMLIYAAQYERFQAAINPYIDPLGDGWMAVKTREIITNANFIGASDYIISTYGTDTKNILPIKNTEFLLTYLIDKWGWISFIGIMLILAIFVIRCFKAIMKQNNILGGIVSMSIMINFIMQIISYVVFNLGFQMFAPLALPLISFGRTSGIINMFLIGIMLSVFRNSSLYSSRELANNHSKKKFSYVDGKIIIDLNK